jgi:hypothetical protein
MTKPEYVELEFAMPFYEMYFPDTWNDNKLPKNPFELIELCEKLMIKLDTGFLYEEYEKTEYKKGDIYIFYATSDRDIFLYFDLLKDEYDQMAMVVIGVRIKTIDRETVREVLEKFYFKSTTRSDFQEDYFNHSLYRVATNRIPFQKRTVRHFLDGRQLPAT